MVLLKSLSNDQSEEGENQPQNQNALVRSNRRYFHAIDEPHVENQMKQKADQQSEAEVISPARPDIENMTDQGKICTILIFFLFN